MSKKKLKKKYSRPKLEQEKGYLISQPRYSRISTAVLIAGYILNVIAFWPGFMTQDSWFQYLQAVSGDYQDGHPPIMALAWSFLLKLLSGPSGMLILQLSFFWVGLYLIWEKFSAKPKAFLIVLIGIFPWIISISGVIWKDLQMAYTLFLAIALIMGERTKAKVVFVSVLLFYSYSVRKNAPLAVIPVILFALGSWWSLKKSQVITLLVLTIVSFSFVGNFLNYSVLDAKRTNIQNASYIDDLANLSLRQGKSLIPKITYSDIVSCEKDTVAGSNLIGKEGCLLTRPSYQNYLDAQPPLQQIWLNSILKDLKGYVQLHSEIFAYQLIKPSAEPYGYWVSPGVTPDAVGIKQRDNFFTNIVKSFVDFSINNFQWVFKPLIWLGILFWTIYPISFLKNKSVKGLTLTLTVSGILYCLGYFVIGGSADYRYFYWPILAANLSVVLLVVNKRELVFPTEYHKIGLGIVALLIAITMLSAPVVIASL